MRRQRPCRYYTVVFDANGGEGEMDPQRVEIGLGLRSGARGYRLIRKARQLAEIHINIDHRNAVSAFDKSGGYLAARRERNVSFGAEPACKNKNIHHCFLSYNAYPYN